MDSFLLFALFLVALSYWNIQGSSLIYEWGEITCDSSLSDSSLLLNTRSGRLRVSGSGRLRVSEEDDRSKLTLEADGLSAQVGLGCAFYNALQETVSNIISNIYPPNGRGEWHVAFDQQEVEAIKEKMREMFPDVMKEKSLNMERLIFRAWQLLKEKRERVITALRKAAKNAHGDWANIPKSHNLSEEDLKIALPRAMDPEKKYAQRIKKAVRR